MSTLPKVSVITTTYNDAANLERVMDQEIGRAHV